MTKRIGFLSSAVLLAFASGLSAQQYSMQLLGTYNTNNWGGAYVSPYTGTVGSKGVYLICDDYITDVNIGDKWTATASQSNSLNGTEKFFDGGHGPDTGVDAGFTAKQDYDAAAWLANELLLPSNLANPTLQDDYSYAIWNIFDPGLKTINGQDPYGPDGGALALIKDAFAEVKNGYAATNVTVYTPCTVKDCGFSTPSQEYLVVDPPVQTPEPDAAAILGFDFLSVLAGILLVGRYRARV